MDSQSILDWIVQFIVKILTVYLPKAISWGMTNILPSVVNWFKWFFTVVPAMWALPIMALIIGGILIIWGKTIAMILVGIGKTIVLVCGILLIVLVGLVVLSVVV